jgi:hypothetical protein
MKPLILLMTGLVIGVGIGCTRAAPVRAPEDAVQCGERPAHENNCVACTSQPSCGWCEHPQAGQVNCQASATAATSCSANFHKSTNECPAPLEVPPGAVE